ncbi:MAG: DUF1365 family protein [Alphaproteobacteria bacterium]|jgi:DUF1365 family protein|nr:DUF1365 family protein [Alphaproteobacteria bacterium]
MSIRAKLQDTALSSAYVGQVVHMRKRPRVHRLQYRVFYLLLDLDNLPNLGRKLRLFGYNRSGLFSFHERDHGPRNGSSLRAWVDTQLDKAGIAIPGGRVTLLCLPRIFGYVFNPISIFYCFDDAGQLKATLYEVSNTFRESHTYLLPVENGTDTIVHHSFDKELYVSPFIPMACRYEVALRKPDARASIAIREYDAEGALLVATFHGARTCLNDAFLLSTIVRFPLLTMKVMVGIHWDALRIWLKGMPILPHPIQPSQSVSIIKSPRSLPDVRVRTN